MDPKEEASRLAELLRDDFIDDLTSGEFMPVQLPMVDTGEKNYLGIFNGLPCRKSLFIQLKLLNGNILKFENVSSPEIDELSRHISCCYVKISVNKTNPPAGCRGGTYIDGYYLWPWHLIVRTIISPFAPLK